MNDASSSPEPAAPSDATVPAKGRLVKVAVVVLACLAMVGMLAVLARREPLPQVLLADGRILQIEGVTYGTNHRIGSGSVVVEHLGPWLPSRLYRWLEPKQRESKLELDHPALVVWVNAINPQTGTNVDCQGIRTEFVDKDGELLGEETRSWFGGQNFWRVGHIFYAYPRDEQELTFQITPWRTNRASTVKFRNPKRFSPREWAGLPLPQTNKTAAVEFVLTALTMRTNGGPKGYWQTRTRFWEPAWEFRQDGKPAAGWADPEWTAEDAWGNRGKFLGVHQPVLRFSATVYPEATNTRSASLVATLPQVSPSLLTTNVWWNQPCKMSSNEFMAMGICTPGVHVFCDGKYDTNSPAGMGPVSGGAPSGWTGQSRRINPLQVKVQTGHYTPLPTVYIHAPDLQPPLRLGLRLRDTNGLFWAAEPEKQGSSQGVHAFLVKLPTNVTEVLPELVLLKPVVTEFLVRTSPQK